MDLKWAGWAMLALFLGVVVGASWWRRWRRSRRARRTTRRAVRAEHHAVALLERHGFEVEEIQPRLRWSFTVDGRPTEVDLRADFLVRRGSGRFVADVKTGRAAPQVTHAPTRRQLLEYRVAYDVDGVLLVDMEAREIHTVNFGVN